MVNQQSKAEAGKEDILFWQRVLQAHLASGLTVRRFCETEGLVVWRFYYWRKKLRGAVKSLSMDPVRFKQIAEISPSPVECRIEFPDGVLLHIPDRCDPSRLEQVIALLRDLAC